MIKEIDITKENLSIFFDNLRYEDYLELANIYVVNLKENFISSVLSQKEVYFLADYSNYPLVIGGLSSETAKKARVWLLFAKGFEKHRYEIFRYIKKKLVNYKRKYELLYNYVFESNFGILNWLKKQKFILVDTVLSTYKLFYFKKGGKFDL